MIAYDAKRWFLQAAALTGQHDALDPAEKNLIDLALRDASDANIPPTLPPAPDASFRHPLSAEQIASASEIAYARDHGDKNFGTATNVDELNHLWFDVTASNAAQLPASASIPDHSLLAQRSLAAALIGARYGNHKPALLYLHIGPVQSFVEASRRTHDLFVSSFCIAYLTMQAIQVIAKQEGTPAILVPWLADVPLAQALLHKNKKSFDRNNRVSLLRSSLPNKVLAIVPLTGAEKLARAAAGAAYAEWTIMAKTVQERLIEVSPQKYKDAFKTWDEQIAQHLEIDAIVQPWPTTREGVRHLLERADMKEAHAEELRDDLNGQPATDRIGTAFGQLYHLSHQVMSAHRKTDAGPPTLGDRRPKCALCGIREQMGPIAPITKSQESQSRIFFQELRKALVEYDIGGPMQLNEGEALCAVCLTKRFASAVYFGGNIPPFGLDWNKTETDRFLLRYPSVPSIASAPFRLRVQEHAEARRDANELAIHVQALMKNLHDEKPFAKHPGNLLPGLGDLGHGSPWLALEGQWLYESNYDPTTAWANIGDGSDNEGKISLLRRELPDLQKAFAKLQRQVDAKPSAYYAVLMLDGDRMGKWLTGRHDCIPKLGEYNSLLDETWRDKRRPFGPALQGELSRRLSSLALALYEIVENKYLGRIVYSGGDDLLAFLPLATALPCLRAIQREARKPAHLGNRFTVSAGLAITHMRTPLREALRLAREAEKISKRTRDAFTITVERRSGGQSEWTLPFTLARKGKPNVDTLEGLLELLTWDPPRKTSLASRDAEEHPLRSVNVAYRLAEEVEVLAALDDQAPFRSRLQTLVGKGFTQESAAYALLYECDFGAHDIVNILHLVRFLLREERGIITQDLVRERESKQS